MIFVKLLWAKSALLFFFSVSLFAPFHLLQYYTKKFALLLTDVLLITEKLPY